MLLLLLAQVYARQNFRNVFVALRNCVLMRGKMTVDEAITRPFAQNPNANRALVGNTSKRSRRNRRDRNIADALLQRRASSARNDHQPNKLLRRQQKVRSSLRPLDD